MSSIEWTGKTLNAFVGCRRVSAGCTNCYAERFVHRGMSPQHRGLTVKGKTGPRWSGNVNYVPHRFDEMLRTKKRDRWFINSLSDLFFEPVPFKTIAALLGMIAVAHEWHGHTAQILTKRPMRAVEFFDWLRERSELGDPRRVYQSSMGWFSGYGAGRLAVRTGQWHDATDEVVNVKDPFPFHLGVSVESQWAADRRVPLLLQCPAAVRFVSAEPLLEGIDLRRLRHDGVTDIDALSGRHGLASAGERTRVGWLIVGGESGPGARPFDIAWARSMIEQCRAASTPCFIKQLGARPYDSIRDWRTDSASSALLLADRKGGDMSEWPEDLRVREFPKGGR